MNPSKEEIEKHNLLHDPDDAMVRHSAFSQRAETTSTDRQDRKSFQ